jgi:hypothetical protein
MNLKKMKNTREIKIPPYSPVIEFAIVGLLTVLLFSSFWIVIDTHELSSPVVSSSSSAATSAKLPSVKIISPHKGQQVPPNSILPVSGTSSAPLSSKLNATASACKVSVLLNAVKPYQKTVATGYGGRNDYSSWRYTITPNYASIKEGQNKITAKVTCAVDTGNNITKFNSVNVTGVLGGASPLVVNGQNGKNGTNGVSGPFFGGNNGNIGKDGSAGNTIGGNGGTAIGGQGGNGGNGGSGGSAIGGNGGNGGSGRTD